MVELWYVKNDEDCSLDATCSISVYGEKELVIFNNNSAEVGPIIYGGRVDKCTSNDKEQYVFVPGFCSC